MKNIALFNTILANPLNDAPRLAYAKWLKDNGDKDRADFIKVQCDRAAKSHVDPAQERLAKKEKSLLKKHEAEWLAELPEWARRSAKFRRGFVGLIQGDLDEIVKRFAELVKVTPVSGLEPFGTPDTKTVQALAKCPQAAQLDELSLWHCEVNDAGVRAIAESPHFDHLRTLQFGNFGLSDTGLKTLAASPYLTGLTALNLNNCKIGPDGLTAIFASKWKLTQLTLHGISLRGSAMTALANWEGLNSVVELGIGSCEIGPEESKALAASPHLKNLKVLDISSNPFTAKGIDAIAGSSWLPQLTALHIQNSELSDEVGRSILAWPELPHLKYLCSVNNQFTYETTLALIDRYGAT